jgi:hypothetical protein
MPGESGGVTPVEAGTTSYTNLMSLESGVASSTRSPPFASVIFAVPLSGGSTSTIKRVTAFDSGSESEAGCAVSAVPVPARNRELPSTRVIVTATLFPSTSTLQVPAWRVLRYAACACGTTRTAATIKAVRTLFTTASSWDSR